MYRKWIPSPLSCEEWERREGRGKGEEGREGKRKGGEEEVGKEELRQGRGRRERRGWSEGEGWGKSGRRRGETNGC